MTAGRLSGIRPGGYRVLEGLRMEKGYRYYGTDLTLLDNPLEAGLGFCLRFHKPEVNGRERLLAAPATRISRRGGRPAEGGGEYLSSCLCAGGRRESCR